MGIPKYKVCNNYEEDCNFNFRKNVTLMQTAFRFMIIENKLHFTQESQQLIFNQPSRLKIY